MAIEYILWHYTPSVPLAIAFCVVFTLITVTHLFGLVQSRAKYCIPFVIGGIFEAVGYGARAVAHYHIKSTMPYAIQSLLILLGPILFAASIYMILKRIVNATGAAQLSIIPARWLTKVFVLGDVTCFLVQGAGGGFLSGAKSQNDINIGQYIILTGLISQIIVFGIFVFVAGTFHLRLLRSPGYSATSFPWQRYLFMLYGVSALVTLRNVFRAIEYGIGSSGYLLTHEWTLYTFDGALMIIVLGICVTWYSCRFESTVGPRRDLEESSSTEMEVKRNGHLTKA